MSAAIIRIAGQVYTVGMGMGMGKGKGRVIPFRRVHPDAEAIERYVMGYREAVAAHIKECLQCIGAVEDAREYIEAMRAALTSDKTPAADPPIAESPRPET